MEQTEGRTTGCRGGGASLGGGAVNDLPAIITSRVGPQVVDTMATALDDILASQVHRGDCVPWEPCRDGCPMGIAAKAVQKIGLLTNLAVVGG